MWSLDKFVDRHENGEHDPVSSQKEELEGFVTRGRHSSSRGSRRWTWVLASAITVLIAFVIFGLLVRRHSSSRDKRCLSPARRKEWRHLDYGEKQDYISAVMCLHELPSRITGEGHLSDDFPWIHKRIGEITHYAAPFLPWHRYFIHLYETALRESCGYRGSLPYWDWTQDWEDPAQSPIWSLTAGFGGDGTSGGDMSVRWGTCIAEGPFSNYEVHWENRTAKPHCLSRGFGRQDYPARFVGSDFSPSQMKKTFENQKFIDFSLAIEIGPHNALPMNICGDFMLFEAPNDPVFFLHHAQMDRLWWLWQEEAELRYSGGALEYNGPKEGESKIEGMLDDVLPMHGLGPDLPVSQLMSTESDLFCYTYV